MDNDTIAAIATPPGYGGIAIVRISGPAALAVADRLRNGGSAIATQPSHTVRLRWVVSETGTHIDRAVWLVFRGPRSYTGEDLVEIQCHGGFRTARRILSAACAAGARVAGPGEFTRRAFLNGKIDLLQAEAVLDLIRAQTDRAASAALEQLEGRLSREISEIRRRVISALAAVETAIDFSEDIDGQNLTKSVSKEIHAAISPIDRLVSCEVQGRILREGVTIAIVGKPNTGKSTLFNALLGSDRSIVNPHPGTTRDTIEDYTTINGILIRLVDTAGIRPSDCEIELEGIRRAQEKFLRCDVVLYVIDSTIGPDEQDQRQLLHRTKDAVILVLNKSDIATEADRHQLEGAVKISALTGQGLDDLRKELEKRVESLMYHQHFDHFAVSERHAQLLRQASQQLREALAVVEGQQGEWAELAAIHLRSAALSLGEITGEDYYPEMLDSIFQSFCIGK